MKFNISRFILFPILQKLMLTAKAPGRTEATATSHVFLSADTKSQKVLHSSTNAEVTTRCYANADVQSSGKALVPIRILFDLVKNLPGDSDIVLWVEINENESGQVHVESGKSYFKLSYMDPEAYTGHSKGGNGTEFSVPSGDLLKLLNKTAFAMGRDSTRPAMDGIFLTAHQDKIRAVATDAHRMAIHELPSALHGAEEGQEVILPRNIVQVLLKALSGIDDEELVVIHMNDIDISFSWEETELISRLVAAKYPNWQRVVPEPGDLSHMFFGNKFLVGNAIKRIQAVANQKSFNATLSFRNDGYHEIVSNNVDQSAGKEILEGEYQGEAQKIGFNLRYALEVFNALDGEEFILQIQRDKKTEYSLTPGNALPMLVTSPKDKNTRVVLMPMQS
ncbi:DNA polymerase III subunit beta [Magnetococcales bacterium HHB-1]